MAIFFARIVLLTMVAFSGVVLVDAAHPGTLNNGDDFWWIAGDLDNDYDVDMDDMDILSEFGDLTGAGIPVASEDKMFDLTGDGWVNLQDRDLMRLYLAGFKMFLMYGKVQPRGLEPLLLADADGDGDVDGQCGDVCPGLPGDGSGEHSDYYYWWSNRFTYNGKYSNGDFNCDGMVDGADFIIWNANKGRVWSGLEH